MAERDPIKVVDAALAEFSSRDAVPADDLINAIGEIDPPAAAVLAGFVSRYTDKKKEGVPTLIRADQPDPGVLHARDALNVLLDLRLSLAPPTPTAEAPVDEPPAELAATDA